MDRLHLILDNNSPALQWANQQMDKIGARGHVGTHLDCYLTTPERSEYIISAYIIDCTMKMPDMSELQNVPPLDGQALVLLTDNLGKNEYGTKEYFDTDTFLTEDLLQIILEKKPLFIIIDSHGIGEKGIKHITLDKICEKNKCHVIENVDLSSLKGRQSIQLKIIIDIKNQSTGKPCELYNLSIE